MLKNFKKPPAIFLIGMPISKNMNVGEKFNCKSKHIILCLPVCHPKGLSQHPRMPSPFRTFSPHPKLCWHHFVYYLFFHKLSFSCTSSLLFYFFLKRRVKRDRAITIAAHDKEGFIYCLGGWFAGLYRIEVRESDFYRWREKQWLPNMLFIFLSSLITYGTKWCGLDMGHKVRGPGSGICIDAPLVEMRSIFKLLWLQPG